MEVCQISIPDKVDIKETVIYDDMVMNENVMCNTNIASMIQSVVWTTVCLMKFSPVVDS